jgi:hypothetical protein
LFLLKSAEIAEKKKATVEGPRKPQYLRRDVKKHKKLLMDKKSGETEASSSTEVSNPELVQAIKSTENLRLRDVDVEKIPPAASSSICKLNFFPKLTGLNSLGYFDYTHYGHLKTPFTPEHEFMTKPTPTVAIDCEMVGVGPMKEDALARVSIVNEFGYCLYDKFVKPKLQVVDYRTEFSGVREEDLKNGKFILQSFPE